MSLQPEERETKNGVTVVLFIEAFRTHGPLARVRSRGEAMRDGMERMLAEAAFRGHKTNQNPFANVIWRESCGSGTHRYVGELGERDDL